MRSEQELITAKKRIEMVLDAAREDRDQKTAWWAGKVLDVLEWGLGAENSFAAFISDTEEAAEIILAEEKGP